MLAAPGLGQPGQAEIRFWCLLIYEIRRSGGKKNGQQMLGEIRMCSCLGESEESKIGMQCIFRNDGVFRLGSIQAIDFSMINTEGSAV